jgi:hypothetical protein
MSVKSQIIEYILAKKCKKIRLFGPDAGQDSDNTPFRNIENGVIASTYNIF